MNRSEIELKTMGKQASAEYLYNSVPMNKTIIGMAKEAGLNPHQVARVCEAANINTYDTLWSMNKNGEFTFDMADQEKIAESLSQPDSLLIDETNVPVETFRDLLPPETSMEDSEKQSALSKTASALEAAFGEKEISQKRYEKTAAGLTYYKNELELAMEEARCQKCAAESRLTQYLKEAALHGEDISEAYAAARLAFPENENEIKNIFTKVASELKKNNISFSTSHKTAGVIRSEDAHGRSSYVAINKKHPVIRYLDTILDRDRVLSEGEEARGFIVSKIESIKNGIRRHDLNKE